jgi:phosphatidylserine/phosphatidylglycerophosphate/cardiolipin synthase-like enzyme
VRFKSKLYNGYQVFAVSGVNTISFAIAPPNPLPRDLLGFAVEREDTQEKERYYMYGFKVFKELCPDPNEYTLVSTYDNPIQSFVWDDFTAKPGYTYTYYFHPLKGKPKNLVRESPIKIIVTTEPLYSEQEHDIFFNRGVASSQAYARKFNNLPPDKINDPDKQKDALQWLSRDLDEALLKFINQAENRDTLLGCFYEFTFEPVLNAFKQAIDRGVTVKLIIDAKDNQNTNKNGKSQESFPRKGNLEAIRKANIPDNNIIMREARKNDIQHNKFIVYLAGQIGTEPKAKSVWTGSTNISQGGIAGQTNVGHWVRNEIVAAQFTKYWEILSKDPGGEAGDIPSEAKRKNEEFRKTVIALQADIPCNNIPEGTTAIFSPRKGTKMLNNYAEMVDQAKGAAAITLAFGVNKAFKELLKDNTQQNRIVFMLLDKKDSATAKNKDTFIRLGAKNNVYQAYGSYIKDPLYAWTKKEINTRGLKLNTHVAYVHTKILITNPLGDDPVVVTGSANFSEPSIDANDENMIIIRKNYRAADIYFSEFNRLFNHYYYRSVVEELQDRGIKDEEKVIFLKSDDSWLEKYKTGTFRDKRLQMFKNMQGVAEIH